MALLLRMPGISADANEAALVEWSAEPGATLKAGDAIAVVETEKANVDIPVEEDAVLWRTLASAGESVEVGSPIAVLLGIGEDASAGEALLANMGLAEASPAEPAASAAPADTPTVAEPVAAPAVAPAVITAEPASGSPTLERPAGTRIFATPLVRKLARDAAIPLGGIQGSGPQGRIVRSDIMPFLAGTSLSGGTAAPSPSVADIPVTEVSPPAASAAAQSAPAAAVSGWGSGYTDIPHTRLRRAIATALVGSKQNAPHFYLTSTLRVDDLLALRAQINMRGSTRVSINDLFVKAAARAFRDVPDANVNWTPDAVRRFDRVDISVAIGSERGLVTPVIRDADRLSVSDVGAQVRDFVVRADEGRLRQDEIVGGCFTISNLGMFGVEQFSAIINPPQVGILAVGAVVEKPVVVDGRIEIAKTVSVTASFDHRPIDGVLAAKWLAAFTAAVEDPLTILI